MLHAMRLGLLLTLGAIMGGCPAGLVQVGTSVLSSTAGSAESAGTGEFSDCYVPAEGSAWAAEVIQLVNDERAKYGLNALAPSAELSQAANAEACDMIHYNYFDHINPVTGSSPLDRFAASGFEGNICGENIAAGQQSPEQVVDGWIGSPEHEDNVLSPAFTHMGIGIRLGGPYRIYWVQLFGGP
jgi:uncharacterized protein YkwD